MGELIFNPIQGCYVWMEYRKPCPDCHEDIEEYITLSCVHCSNCGYKLGITTYNDYLMKLYSKEDTFYDY